MNSALRTPHSSMSRPGYKQTEVGVIPEEWEVVNLECAAGIVDPQPDHRTPPECTGGDPYIGISDFLDDSTINWEASRKIIPKAVDKQRARFQLRSGDIIFGKIGTIGMPKFVPAPQFRYGLSANVLLLQPKVEPFYLMAWLRSDTFQRAVNSELHSTSQAAFGINKMRRMLVPTPPPPEQRAIAEALSDVDGLLDGLDRLIAKKRDLKQAAMQQLLTGQTRLPGFHGEWAVMKLVELCDYVDGVPTSGGDLGYLEIGDVNVETKSYDVAQKEKLSVRGAVKVPAGTLLISTVRPTRGAIVITKSALHVSSAFCRVRPVNGLLFHLVCQPKFLAYLGENSIGGTYPTCRDETILGYESELPGDPAEQTAIAEVLTEMDAELAALEQRREKTRALKQAMMQVLLTGRIRLIASG